jgi:hypothetical protein
MILLCTGLGNLWKYTYKRIKSGKSNGFTPKELTGISGSSLYARDKTREPWRVYFLYVSTYAAGKSTNLSWMVSGAPWKPQDVKEKKPLLLTIQWRKDK